MALLLDKSKLKEVTSIKMFEDSKLRRNKLKYIDQDGLLSERIFGSLRSYKCSSKCISSPYRDSLELKKDEGKICKNCGVKSTNNFSRYKIFGKITLPFQIIRTTKKKEFQYLVNKKFNHILDPKRNDLSSSVKSFLEYDICDHTKLKLTDTFNNLTCIPLNITGVYSLFLAFTIADKYLGNLKAKEYLTYFYKELLVVPPNSRYSVVGNESGKKKLIIDDLDDIYQKILYLKKGILSNSDPQKQLSEFYNMIVNTMEAKMFDYIDDSEIQGFDSAASILQYRCDTVYGFISDKLSGKEGLIRKDFLGKYIDFSSRAIIIPDPSLDTYQIKLPKKIFIRLWLIEYSRWLWKIKKVPFEKIRLFVKSTDIHEGYLEFVDEFIEFFFKNAGQKERLVFLNRQPTLWRYGCSTVEVVGITQENVIKV
ncbi:MAG: hypothetical protein H8D97_01290, partial [Proteobacteria bacterium]|nr:hypothetical protein [Pseudomonadota bacterium]